MGGKINNAKLSSKSELLLNKACNRLSSRELLFKFKNFNSNKQMLRYIMGCLQNTCQDYYHT